MQYFLLLKGDDKLIYFDNAATTLHKPECVIKAVANALITLGNPGRGAHNYALEASRTVNDARNAAAKLINAKKGSEIAFTSNATEALNTAIYGLFSEGDSVISTMCEHNSVLRPLCMLEEKGVNVSYANADEKGIIDYDSVEKAIKKNTKAFVINHISNVTGNITDIDFFSKLKEKYGLLLIVDGAQSAGSIPIDVIKSNIDVFCFTGHKSLMGPQGTGGIYVREGVKIRPLKSGGSGIHSYNRHHPDIMPEALEAGTLNCHGLAGLNAGIEYIIDKGISDIQRYENILVDRFYNGIKDIKGVKVYGDFTAGKRGPVVSINIGDMDSAYVCHILAYEYNIAVRGGAHCAPLMHKALGTDKRGAVRFSFGIYNTAEEIDTAVSAIYDISAGKY